MLFHIKWKFFQKFGFAIVLACTYFATGMYLALLIRIPAEFQSGDSTLWIMTLLFLYTRRRMQDFLLGNHSSLTEFILLGFSGNTKINVILFSIFLFLYLVTLLGNGLIITLIRKDSRL